MHSTFTPASSEPIRDINGQIGSFLPTGLDVGNGALKLSLDGGEILMPSYLVVKPTLFDEPSEGHVLYLDGDRSELIGTSWLSGGAAQSQSPKNLTRTTDSLTGKPDYALQLLLGALSYLPHRQYWNLLVGASVHDAETYGDALSQAIAGIHSVDLGGKHSMVAIRVVKIWDEGVGALAEHSNRFSRDNDVVLDLGNGTTAVSKFGAKSRLEARHVEYTGVEALISSIATHVNTRKALGKNGTPHLIRVGLENGTFAYGTTGHSFEAEYVDCLKGWLSQVLAPVWTYSEPWRETARTVVAIGGGTMLPRVPRLLDLKGITVLPDGCWANARGLRRLVEMKVSRGLN
jgi:hypothetical protein